MVFTENQMNIWNTCIECCVCLPRIFFLNTTPRAATKNKTAITMPATAPPDRP